MSILNWFRKKTQTPQEWRANQKRHKSIPEDLWNAIWINRKCPDCQSEEFFLGPHGGMCQNIMCANPKCGSKFNLAPFDEQWCDTPFIMERINNDPKAY